MSIFTRLFGSKEQRESAGFVDSASFVDAVRKAVADLSQSASSRVSVDEQTSLLVPAYLRALNVIAQHLAVLPFRYMWQKDGVYVEKEGDNQHYLTSVQMMDGMSNYQFFYQLAFRCVHRGEALVYPRIINGEVAEYVLVGTDEASCYEHDAYNAIYHINDVQNGVYGTFHEDQVLHFVWNSVDGKHGIPLWKLCKPALDIAATGDKETQRRFESGGNVSGIVSNNVQQSGNGGVGQYKTQTLEAVAEGMEQRLKEGSKIIAVGGDAKFSPFSMTSTDMQFVDQQKRAVDEIGRASSVPTYYLFVESSATKYNTPEASRTMLFTQCIEPMCRMIESEWQRKMVPRSLCHKRIFKFDREAIYALDLVSKADYIAKTIANGTHTINDWRKRENQPAIEGGDEALCTANLMTIDALKAKGASPNPSEGGEQEPEPEPQKKEKQRDSKGRFIKQE